MIQQSELGLFNEHPKILCRSNMKKLHKFSWYTEELRKTSLPASENQ